MADSKEVVRAIAELEARQPWWQRIEVVPGVFTRPEGEYYHVGKGAYVPIGVNSSEKKYPELKKLLPPSELSGKSLLDVGCNEGFYSFEAAMHGASVIGVDASPLRIEKARFVQQFRRELPVQFLHVDLFEIRTGLLQRNNGRRYDFAYALGMLHRVPRPRAFICLLAHLAESIVLDWEAAEIGGIEDRRQEKSYDQWNSSYYYLSVDWVKRAFGRFGYGIESSFARGKRAFIKVTRGYHSEA